MAEEAGLWTRRGAKRTVPSSSNDGSLPLTPPPWAARADEVTLPAVPPLLALASRLAANALASFLACGEDLCLSGTMPGTIVSATFYTTTIRPAGALKPNPQPPSDLAGFTVFPNPFKPGASCLRFDRLPAASRVRIFTLSGRLVRQGEADAAGSWCWDGRNGSGERAASGYYLSVVTSGKRSAARKLAVLR